MGAPFVIPPWMPPELLVLVVNLGRVEDEEVPDWEGGTGVAWIKGSLWMEPGTSQPPKPEPISNPFVAGIESMAWASMASSLSKQGSPRPMGTFRITQVTVPPMLSSLSRW